MVLRCQTPLLRSIVIQTQTQMWSCRNTARVTAGMLSGTRPVSTSILSHLRPNQGATQNAKRLGRGPASGKGKTAGRGHKGQKARQGNGAPRGFEGGQTPIHRLFPKRGFHNPDHEELSPVNLDRIQDWINQGRLDPSQPITIKALVDSRAIHGVKEGVKLLARNKHLLTTPIDIDVTKASEEAIARVEELGGSITCTYRNTLSLRAHLKPEKFKVLPRDAMPTKRKDLEFYTMAEKRGYLAGKIELPMHPIERARQAKAAAVEAATAPSAAAKTAPGAVA